MKVGLQYLQLLDVVGRDEEADADGDEDEADHEEGGHDGASRQDGLPRRQPLLLEGRVVRLLVLHNAGASVARGSGVVSVLFLSVVAGRHHGCNPLWAKRLSAKLGPCTALRPLVDNG